MNIEALQSGDYPITRNLFVVVKQNGQTEQQAGVAYANFLRTQQRQELITQTGFEEFADSYCRSFNWLC